MLSNEDIKKLIEIFATREEINKKLDEIWQEFLNFQNRAEKADDHFQEMTVLSRRIDRQEKWIQKIADKLGIELEY